MATEICLTIEDDGTFTVETEEAAQEAPEEAKEPTGNEQTFKTLPEALAAVGKLASSGTMMPGPDAENMAMSNSYQAKR